MPLPQVGIGFLMGCLGIILGYTLQKQPSVTTAVLVNVDPVWVFVFLGEWPG